MASVSEYNAVYSVADGLDICTKFTLTVCVLILYCICNTYCMYTVFAADINIFLSATHTTCSQTSLSWIKWDFLKTERYQSTCIWDIKDKIHGLDLQITSIYPLYFKISVFDISKFNCIHIDSFNLCVLFCGKCYELVGLLFGWKVCAEDLGSTCLI